MWNNFLLSYLNFTYFQRYFHKKYKIKSIIIQANKRIAIAIIYNKRPSCLPESNRASKNEKGKDIKECEKNIIITGSKYSIQV